MKKITSSLLIAFVAASLGAVRASAERNWTGCYGGGQFGYGWGTMTLQDSSPSNIYYNTTNEGAGLIDYFGKQRQLNVDDGGAMLGGQVGCDYELENKVVLGVSGSAATSQFSGNGESPYTYGEYGSGAVSVKTDSLMDLSLRAGYAADSALFYVKAGVAQAHGKIDAVGWSDYGIPFEGEFTLTGMVFGLGSEWPIASNWTAYVEGDEYYFPNSTVPLQAYYYDYTGYTADVNVRENINVVKVGVNYRWGFAQN